MSFSVVLQRNDSEPNRIIKTVSDILSLSGTLKNRTSIIDPIIIIECNLTDVTECNYMTIDLFNRKYFVNNITSVNSKLVEFSCHVDVLSTFADSIKSNSAIIKKQENLWNLYLNDGSFKVYQNPNVLTRPFPSGFTTQEFVLAVAGK